MYVTISQVFPRIYLRSFSNILIVKLDRLYTSKPIQCQLGGLQYSVNILSILTETQKC